MSEEQETSLMGTNKALSRIAPTPGVYEVQKAYYFFRDNSACLKELIDSDRTMILLLRPSQMGKTTLLHLIETLYSKRLKMIEKMKFLSVTFTCKLKNKCFVLRIDFSSVFQKQHKDEINMENRTMKKAQSMDLEVNRNLKVALVGFLRAYPELEVQEED